MSHAMSCDKRFESIYADNEGPGYAIALDKMLISVQKYWYFSYFSMKTYVVGTHKKCLAEVLLMSTHNICFCGKIWKIFTWYQHLSRPMLCSLIRKDQTMQFDQERSDYAVWSVKIRLCSLISKDQTMQFDQERSDYAVWSGKIRLCNLIRKDQLMQSDQ